MRLSLKRALLKRVVFQRLVSSVANPLRLYFGTGAGWISCLRFFEVVAFCDYLFKVMGPHGVEQLEQELLLMAATSDMPDLS